MTDPANLPPPETPQPPHEAAQLEEYPETARELLAVLEDTFEYNENNSVPPIADERTDEIHAVTLRGDSFTIRRTFRQASQASIDETEAANRAMRRQMRRARGVFSKEYREFQPPAATTESVSYTIEWHEPGDSVTNKIGAGRTTDTNKAQTEYLQDGLLDTGQKGESFPLTGELLKQKVEEAAEVLKNAVVLNKADMAASRQMGPASEVRGEEAMGLWQKVAPTVLAALSPRDPTSQVSESDFAGAARYVQQPDDTDGLPIRSIQTLRAPALPGEAPYLITNITFESSPFTSDSELRSHGSFFTVAIVQNTRDLSSTTISYYFAHPTIGGKRIERAGVIEKFEQEPVLLDPEVRQRVTGAIGRQLSDPDQLTRQRPERYDQ